jgi:hypothetical protein
MSALSVQINYLSPFGVKLTCCVEPAEALEVARNLHNEGRVVGSVAIFEYTGAEVRTIALWYCNDDSSYYGVPIL